jgi:hypothetical protein
MTDVHKLNQIAKRYPSFDTFFLEKQKEAAEQLAQMMQMREAYELVHGIVTDSGLENDGRFYTTESCVMLSFTLNETDSLQKFRGEIIAPIGSAVQQKGWHDTGVPATSSPLESGGSSLCFDYKWVYWDGGKPTDDWSNRRIILVSLYVTNDGCKEYEVETSYVTREITDVVKKLVPRVSPMDIKHGTRYAGS